MQTALDTNNWWAPQDLSEFRGIHAGNVIGLQDMVEELRFYTGKLDTADPDLATDVISLLRAMVDRVNWLAKAGKLGKAPCAHETWPINYAPDAGKGASKWEPAYDRYRQLGCGKVTVLSRIAGQVSHENVWTQFAEDGVRAALLAKGKAPWVDEHRKSPRLEARQTIQHARKTLVCDYYLCRDGLLILWPSWAEQSRNLPDKLTKDTWRDFLPVVRELVRVYLLSDEETMLQVLNRVSDGTKIKAWDSDLFNNDVMPRIKDALKSLADR